MIHRHRIAAALAGLLVAAAPAAAQPVDPLGLGEFGAYLDREQARQMIKRCDSQTRDLKTRLEAFVAAMKALERRERGDAADAAAWHAEWREANRALAEAETRLANLRGAEADRFAAQVVEPRRQRVREIEIRRSFSPLFVGDALEVASRHARSALALLHELGVPEDRIARGTIAQLVHDQSERCRRMRLWAQLGESR